MFNNEYLTINGPAQGLYKDKGSRFIGMAFRVHNEEEVKNIITDIKKKYYDASHHCYAYYIGHYGTPATRSNDDGEPSGTAGKPIMGQILSHDLKDVLIVVVRYFGGIKLGVSGLIAAYKTCAENTLLNSKIISVPIEHVYSLCSPYNCLNDIMTILKRINAKIYHTKYENEQVNIEFSVSVSTSNHIDEYFEKLYQLPPLKHIKVL